MGVGLYVTAGSHLCISSSHLGDALVVLVLGGPLLDQVVVLLVDLVALGVGVPAEHILCGAQTRHQGRIGGQG